MKTVSVIGVGYVGLTMATVLANSGLRVMAVDKDDRKLEALKRGDSGFYDPGLDVFLRRALKRGRLNFCDYDEAIPASEMAFICVGTPLKKDGELDLSDNLEAIEAVIKRAGGSFVIVQKSTVPVGTGGEIAKLMVRSASDPARVEYVANPEFLREGSAVFDALFFDRLVVGSDSGKAMNEVINVYKKIASYAKTINMKSLEEYAFLYTNGDFQKKLPSFEKRVFRTDTRSAEMIKMVANSFLGTKISFANLCQEMCERVGADSKMVLDAVGADKRIGRDFLYPGLGFGGSCLPKDLSAMIKLGEKMGARVGLLEGVKEINDKRSAELLKKIRQILKGDLKGKRVAFLGISFKGGTSDTRMSPALKLYDLLKRSGAKVKVFDPHAKHRDMVSVDEIFKGAELIVIGSEWKEFSRLDFKKIAGQVKQPVIFDVRGVFDARGGLQKKRLEKSGFKVLG